METLIQETKHDIALLEAEMVLPSEKCTHMTCPECEVRILKEAESRLLTQVRINEKYTLLEKINQYGII